MHEVEEAKIDFRKKLEAKMRETLKDEQVYGNFRYVAARPETPPPSYRHGQHVNGDCSKGVQYLCRWSGLPMKADPMGNNWGAYGNSQTIWSHLQHLDHPSQLEVGDIVTFGHDGDEHAAMVLERGNDPLLWSWGHQGAPNTYRLSYDRRPKQFCRLPVPNYVPTPDDKLRAKTGWFAWMAWALGEGDWRHKGKANKNVRPNVPKRIPLSWWRRRAKFLLNRKKANKAKGPR